jgi:hypothetical protein
MLLSVASVTKLASSMVIRVTLFFAIAWLGGSGQNSIYLKPALGIHFPQAHVIDRGKGETPFNIVRTRPLPWAGIGLQLSFKKTDIACGINFL